MEVIGDMVAKIDKARIERATGKRRGFGRPRRRDLLEQLVEVMEENERLIQDLTEANRLLEERAIALQDSESVAEAALRLCGFAQVIKDAQDLYEQSGGTQDSEADKTKALPRQDSEE